MYFQYIEGGAVPSIRSNAGEELRETRCTSSTKKLGQFQPSAQIIVRWN